MVFLGFLYVNTRSKSVFVREDEMRYSFDVGKCDRIFDALLKDKVIRVNHVMPSPDELR